MSKWQTAKLEDIDIDEDYMTIQLEPDSEGNNYVEIRIKDIIRKLKENYEMDYRI